MRLASILGIILIYLIPWMPLLACGTSHEAATKQEASMPCHGMETQQSSESDDCPVCEYKLCFFDAEKESLSPILFSTSKDEDISKKLLTTNKQNLRIIGLVSTKLKPYLSPPLPSYQKDWQSFSQVYLN